MDKLTNEFRDSIGFNMRNSDPGFADEFNRWIINKRKYMTQYVSLLNYLFDFGSMAKQTIAELGKGRYDSIAPVLLEDIHIKPTIVSPYANTFYNSTFDKYNGFLDIINGRAVLKKGINCNYDKEIDLDVLLTQFPANISFIVPFLSMIDDDILGIFGTYGSNSDKNKNGNLFLLDILAERIKTLGGEISCFHEEDN